MNDGRVSQREAIELMARWVRELRAGNRIQARDLGRYEAALHNATKQNRELRRQLTLCRERMAAIDSMAVAGLRGATRGPGSNSDE